MSIMALTTAAVATKNCLVLPSSVTGQSISTSQHNTVSISFAGSPHCYPSVYCGRGDRKTKKGKRFIHSYGNSRPRDKNKGRGLPPTPLPPRPPRKDPDDDEKIEVEIDADLR